MSARRSAEQEPMLRGGVHAAAAGHDRRPDAARRNRSISSCLPRTRHCSATWSPRVADAVKKIPGVVDVLNGIDNTISGPAVIFQVDPAIAARAGFTPQEIELDASAIHARRAGAHAGRDQRSRLHRARAVSRADALLARGHSQHAAGEFDEQDRHAGIGGPYDPTAGTDGNPARKPAAGCGCDGAPRRAESGQRDGGCARDRRRAATCRRPYASQYGGAYEEQQKSFRDLVFVLVLAVLLVFIVLLFEFGSFGAPVAILASALLSTAGVFLALLVTGTTFNISSFMGLIMVIGIVAKNGILLLDADQKFRAEGAEAEVSMIRAGERRLRPIMMTALATVAGMTPLALGLGAGSQMLQPLAIAVIGGILASMVLSLVVTPAVHYYISK